MFDVTRSESQSAVLRFFLKYLILEGEAKAGLKLESAQAGAARKKTTKATPRFINRRQ